MIRSAFLVMLGTACALPLVAHAQVNPFRSARVGSGLSQQDLRELRDAGRRLYTQDNVANGASDTWSNSQSGNSGTVTVVDSFQRQGNACRKLRYDIRLKVRSGVRTYTLNWCHQPDGSWKIV